MPFTSSTYRVPQSIASVLLMCTCILERGCIAGTATAHELAITEATAEHETAKTCGQEVTFALCNLAVPGLQRGGWVSSDSRLMPLAGVTALLTTPLHLL
jgi:hypothetical protein